MDSHIDDIIGGGGMNEVDETRMMLELARAYFNHIVKADNLSFAKNMAAIGSSEIGDYLRKKVVEHSCTGLHDEGYAVVAAIRARGE